MIALVAFEQHEDADKTGSKSAWATTGAEHAIFTQFRLTVEMLVAKNTARSGEGLNDGGWVIVALHERQ